jgi:hypothetical protein
MPSSAFAIVALDSTNDSSDSLADGPYIEEDRCGEQEWGPRRMTPVS